MLMKKILTVFGIATFACNSIQANPLPHKSTPFGPPIAATVLLNTSTPHLLQGNKAAPVKTKIVHLMNMNLTSAQKSAMGQAIHAQSTLHNENTITTKLPAHIDLGMNNTEVLDQGWNGTCVAFAVTGAMDALLQKGNYVSQLCILQLSDYLGKQGYVTSAWEGGFADDLLGYFREFGMVSVEQQRLNTCGGLKDYPTEEVLLVKNSLNLKDYYSMSEDFNTHLYWYSLLNAPQYYETAKEDPQTASRVLNDVKTVLAQPGAKTRFRVVFGVQLPQEFCSVGACGQHNAKYDSWVLSNNILKAKDISYGGHEMVITGYDDEAIATDNDGKKHQGLLILRNSWGTAAGDKGNYYMSYDFFRALADEVFVVGYDPDEG